MDGRTIKVVKWWMERADRDFEDETVDRVGSGEEAAIRDVVEEIEEESVVRVATSADEDGEQVAYTIDLSECLPRKAGEELAEADGGVPE